MRHETVTSTSARRADLQGIGYLLSVVSVILLGAVAWPNLDDPAWMQPVLLAGVVTSIAGMFLRYVEHRRQRREVRKAKAMARQS